MSQTCSDPDKPVCFSSSCPRTKGGERTRGENRGAAPADAQSTSARFACVVMKYTPFVCDDGRLTHPQRNRGRGRQLPAGLSPPRPEHRTPGIGGPPATQRPCARDGACVRAEGREPPSAPRTRPRPRPEPPRENRQPGVLFSRGFSRSWSCPCSFLILWFRNGHAFVNRLGGKVLFPLDLISSDVTSGSGLILKSV